MSKISLCVNCGEPAVIGSTLCVNCLPFPEPGCPGKKKVEYLGYQDRVDGTSILLVNEVATRSTVMYNCEKHVLVSRVNDPGIKYDKCY